jgi:CPA1 family monovalent cation:H+ antiporter
VFSIVTLVTFLAVLLVVISLLSPLAVRLRIPLQVLLAATGLLLGFGALFVPGLGTHTASGEQPIGLGFSPEVILTIFLPVLLFEMAMGINVRRMMDALAPVLVLAIVAVIVATAVIGLALWWVLPLSLIGCLIIAAIVSTTDPAAVVALFRDLGAPVQLRVLVEGESLFNDAAAIAILAVLLAMVGGDTAAGFGPGVLGFLREFAGGVVVGGVTAGAALIVMPALRGERAAEITLTVGLAYGSYLTAEYFHVSGVVAVVIAGLLTGSAGRLRIAADNWDTMVEVWEQLGHWANSLVFLIATMLVPRLMVAANWKDGVALVALVASALIARAAVLWGILPLMGLFSAACRIQWRYKLAIVWGGVRGAVTLALAVAVVENRTLSPELRHAAGVLSSGFVLFTLLVNATSLRPLVRRLGLDRLTAAELALRDRVLSLSMENIRSRLSSLAESHAIRPVAVERVEGFYNDQLAAFSLEAALAGPKDGSAAALRGALILLEGYEQERVMGYFRDRVISRDMVRHLSAQAGRLRDATLTEGMTGYVTALARTLRFPALLRVALWLQRRLGLQRPIESLLAGRYEMLVLTRMVVQELDAYVKGRLTQLVGEGTGYQVHALVRERLARIERSINALALQYPDYALAMEARILTRLALRLEAAEHSRLFQEGTISGDVLRALEAQRRARAAELQPLRLDLGLEPEALIGRLPLFAGLEPDQIRRLARLLSPTLVVPGQQVIRRGDHGDAMYFIASGVVQVAVAPEPKLLKTGEFFGELALLSPGGLRTADVVALGYCQLLMLKSRDLQRLMLADAAFRARIDEVSARRFAEVKEQQVD